MDNARLAELRALCEAATEGPWARTDDYVTRADWKPVFPGGKGRTVADCIRKSDAAFIAAARTAVPELLDEVGRLRIELTRANEHGDELYQELDRLRRLLDERTDTAARLADECMELRARVAALGPGRD